MLVSQQMNSPEDIAEDASQRHEDSYESFLTCLKDVKEKIHAEVKVRYGDHSIVDGRIKSLASILGKFVRKGKKWHEVRDKVALKVVLPTEDNVKDFVGAVNDMFPDWTIGVDAKTLEVEKMGYTSIHLDCQCASYVESDGAPLFFEIQVRTMFQDAWYVNDHSLRYKGTSLAIPERMQRGVLRLSALTEMIDEEVARLMDAKSELTTTEPLRAFDVLVATYRQALPKKTGNYAPPEEFADWYQALYTEDQQKDFESLLAEYLKTQGEKFTKIVETHSRGSGSYLAEKDWVFEEPHILMIAERSYANPSKARRTFMNSDWAWIFEPVLQNFARPI